MGYLSAVIKQSLWIWCSNSLSKENCLSPTPPTTSSPSFSCLPSYGLFYFCGSEIFHLFPSLSSGKILPWKWNALKGNSSFNHRSDGRVIKKGERQEAMEVHNKEKRFGKWWKWSLNMCAHSRKCAQEIQKGRKTRQITSKMWSQNKNMN